jgi:hypothetical protein
MNEKIKELAERAGFFPMKNWENTNWHAAGHNDIFEKFADLIIRECVGVCDDLRDSTDYVSEQDMAENCAMAIMKRFGVKE